MIGNAIYVTARALQWRKPDEDDFAFGAKDDADLYATGIGGYYSVVGPKPVAAGLKYLTRYPNKAGIEDVRKARHFAVMRKAWNPAPIHFQTNDIPMYRYVSENELSVPVANALMALDQWVRRGDHPEMERPFSDRTIGHIDAIIEWLESVS